MRGEYQLERAFKSEAEGSPPLARGIPLYLSDEDKALGITPACAGNTVYGHPVMRMGRDHPRLRGEYLPR